MKFESIAALMAGAFLACLTATEVRALTEKVFDLEQMSDLVTSMPLMLIIAF